MAVHRRANVAFAASCLALACGLPAHAEQKDRITSVTPLYSQLLVHQLPTAFVPAHSANNGDDYSHELVLKGETAARWSNMLTVTASKGLASAPGLTPTAFLERMAAGFQQACPQSFSAKGLGTLQVSGHDAYVAVIGCGSVEPRGADASAPVSEMALMVAIKGLNDVYTIQWARRGEPSPTPIAIDANEWTPLFQLIAPIKLCPIVPGEKAPYPSCTDTPAASRTK